MQTCSGTLCAAGCVRDLGRNRKISTQQASMVTDIVAKYITAVGMFGKGAGWGIPITECTLDYTLGGIAEKPGVVDGHIAIRDYLSLTLSFNHDLIDGAPAARFTERLKELIENGYGLIDFTVEPGQAGAEAATMKS